ncbi:MAG: hypothetical protein ACRDHI_08955 [Actinomycetota bacterium]
MPGDATPATRIEIARTDVEHVLSRFHVRLTDPDGSVTQHDVSMSREEWERFGGSYRTSETLIEASFRFLLDREPKEQIMAAFGLGQIAKFFPSFGREIDPDRR